MARVAGLGISYVGVEHHRVHGLEARARRAQRCLPPRSVLCGLDHQNKSNIQTPTPPLTLGIPQPQWHKSTQTSNRPRWKFEPAQNDTAGELNHKLRYIQSFLVETSHENPPAACVMDRYSLDETGDRAPYRKTACVFESTFIFLFGPYPRGGEACVMRVSRRSNLAFPSKFDTPPAIATKTTSHFTICNKNHDLNR